VRMVEVSLDEVVGVVTVGDRLVSATGAVAMSGVVRVAIVVGRAVGGVVPAHCDLVLVDVIAVRVVEVTVVDVVDVALVAYCRVPTVVSVDVVVLGVALAVGHGGSFPSSVFVLVLFVNVVLFGRVLERVLDQLQHVIVGERVVDVAAVSPPLDQALAPKEPQSVADGRHAFSGGLGQLGHACFSSHEHLEREQPSLVTESAEQADGRRTRLGRMPGGQRLSVVLVSALGACVFGAF
jgi:hypothetical protein